MSSLKISQKSNELKQDLYIDSKLENKEKTDCEHIILNIRGKSRNNAKLIGNENAESPDPRMKSS